MPSSTTIKATSNNNLIVDTNIYASFFKNNQTNHIDMSTTPTETKNNNDDISSNMVEKEEPHQLFRSSVFSHQFQDQRFHNLQLHHNRPQASRSALVTPPTNHPTIIANCHHNSFFDNSTLPLQSQHTSFRNQYSIASSSLSSHPIVPPHHRHMFTVNTAHQPHSFYPTINHTQQLVEATAVSTSNYMNQNGNEKEDSTIVY